MGVFIYSSDFVGKYAIPSTSFTDLDSFIDDNEQAYIIDLLGASLYEDFKTKFIANPSFPNNAGYLTIYKGFSVDHCNIILISKGIKIMLMGFIFFDYMRQLGYEATTQGMVVNVPDTGKSAPEANLFTYLNDATNSYKSTQFYINSVHPELFPPEIAPTTINFNGQYKGFSNPLFG